jgi:flavodoxin
MMNALVLYDSQYGNTERIAEAIAGALGAWAQVRAVRVDVAHPAEIAGVDMLIVGCPTQGWKPTPAILSFLEHVASERLHDLAVACFDTRFRMPGWMTGSAAKVMAGKLQEMGASLLAPAESFFVQGREGPLREGELDRAARWARVLVKAMAAPGSAAR